MVYGFSKIHPFWKLLLPTVVPHHGKIPACWVMATDIAETCLGIPWPPTHCRILTPQPDPRRGSRAVEESQVEGRCGSGGSFHSIPCPWVIMKLGSQTAKWGSQRPRQNYQPGIRLKRGISGCQKLRVIMTRFYLQADITGQLNSAFSYLALMSEFWYLSGSSPLWPGRG